MSPTTLAVLACLIGSPDDCRTYRMEVEPGLLCVLRQGAIAQWHAEHPDRRVVRWWCE